MDRRSGDVVQRMIDEWEATCQSLGPDAPPAVLEYLECEIARLRAEKSTRDRPLAGGRRAGDPKPYSSEMRSSSDEPRGRLN